jgi:hypothetical protein
MGAGDLAVDLAVEVADRRVLVLMAHERPGDVLSLTGGCHLSSSLVVQANRQWLLKVSEVPFAGHL